MVGKTLPFINMLLYLPSRSFLCVALTGYVYALFEGGTQFHFQLEIYFSRRN